MNMRSATRPAYSGPASRPTVRQIAEAVAALGVLVAGLTGIPAALALSVGWPLPHHVPSAGQIADALRAQIPGSFWPHLFATLGWLAWAYFVLSVATNLVARLRGRQHSPHRRLGAQGAAAALITAVVVLGQLRATPTARSTAPVSAVTLVADTAPASGPAAVSQPTPVIHRVVEGDTLWGIASAYYGEGEKWPAIYQANVGVPQPGGGALSDAHWIYPGWALVIPEPTQAAPPAPAVPAASPLSPVPAPVIPALAGTGPHRVAEPARTPRSSAPRAQAPRDPDRRLRATSTVPPASAAGSGHGDGLGHASVRPHEAGRTHRATESSHGDDIGALAMGAGIFGLGAIGLVSALDRRRRRQSGRRAPGRRIPLPAPHSSLAELELHLRHYARADSLFWLTRLAELLGHVAGSGSPPQVLGVRVGLEGLDVLVTPEDIDPPAPFEARPGDPTVWHLSYSAEPDGLSDAVVVDPVPLTLVTVGQGDGGTLLVNLEHYRSVHLQVDTDRVPGTLAAISTELAGTTGSRGDKVVAIGFGHGLIDRLPGGFVVDDLDAFLAQHRSEEERIVVLAAATVATDQLVEMAAGSSTCRLLLAGRCSPAGVGLVLDPANPVLAEHGLAPLEATHVSNAVLDDVESLLDLAEAPPITEPDDEPYRRLEVPPARVASLAPASVVLGILGDPSISLGEGEPQDLLEAVAPTAGTKARRVVELLVYLAGHNGSATRGEWLTDISPDKTLGDGYIRNLILLTRRSLQALTGDSELLAYDRTSQRLSLAERVETDWAAFRSLAASGEPQGLRAALSSVRGTPFGSAPEPWTSASGTYYVIVDEVTDAARLLGQHGLSIGDTQLATWAARQGLLANRYDQGLWRVLLRAAGDSGAVQRVWEELHALLAVDGDATADIETDTRDLYDSLMTPSNDTAEVVVIQDDDEAVIPTRQAV
jgi:hypothetical protein